MGETDMDLKILPYDFCICKVKNYSLSNLDGEFVFIAKTYGENSLVCPESAVPENTTEKNGGWKAFRIEGKLDFSLIGIISEISELMAANKIGIFAVSTFDTDYFFIKKENFEQAVQILEKNGNSFA